jgi:hypothetical protein
VSHEKIGGDRLDRSNLTPRDTVVTRKVRFSSRINSTTTTKATDEGKEVKSIECGGKCVKRSAVREFAITCTRIVSSMRGRVCNVENKRCVLKCKVINYVV